MKRLFREESGAVAPLAILMMPLLLGFCALVLDVGMVYANRRALQNAADAAALAGAVELRQELLGSPGDPVGMAQAFAGRNGMATAYGTCTDDGQARISASRPGDLPNSWYVETTRRVGLHFGAVLSMTSMCVTTHALATVVELEQSKIWPWGVLDGTLDSVGYDRSFVLKEGAGNGSSGNYGIVDFDCGGGGTSDYKHWALNGYGTRPGETIPVRLPSPSGATWQICTETGNKVSVNKEVANFVAANRTQGCALGVDVRCPLIGMIPILKESTWPNGTKPVHVMDFAIFELEQVVLQGGHTEIHGVFRRFASGVGPTLTPNGDGTLTGPIGVRLWE